MTGEPISPQTRQEARAATLWFGRFSPRVIIGPGVLIILNLALLWQHLGSDPTVQECEGQIMRPGDFCIDIGGNSSGSYESRVAETIARQWVGPAIYGGFILLALILILAAMIKWLRDRRIRARLDADRPLLIGASQPVRGSILGIVGATVFLGGSAFAASNVITDGWSWPALILIPLVIIGLFNIMVAWPRHGSLIQVHGDGLATIVAEGKHREVNWGEVRLFRSGKPHSTPELRLGEEMLVDLDDGLIGHQAIAAAFPRA